MSAAEAEAMQRELDALEAQMDRARALAQRLRRLAVDQSRRADARRKIILGAALIAAARDSADLRAVIGELLDRIERPADRKPFDGLTVDLLIETALDENFTPRRRPGRVAHKPD